MRRIRYIVFGVSFALISFLVLAEILIRVSGRFSTYSELNDGFFQSPYEEVSSSIFRHHPYTDSQYDKPEFSYSLQTNSFGLRNKETTSKTDSTQRILILGDSFVEGAGAPIDSTWPQLYEHLLNNRNGKNYEVISGGIGGSDPFYYAHLYHEVLLPLDSDIIMAMVNQSDFEDFIIRGGNERFQDETVIYRPPPIKIGFYKWSHLYRFYTHIIQKRDGYYTAPDERTGLLNEAKTEFGQLFNDLNEAVKNDGKELIVVVNPVPGDFLYNKIMGSRLYIHQMTELHQELLEKGITSYDLTACVYDQLGSDLTTTDLYWPIDMHYNSKGYQMMANCTNMLIELNAVNSDLD